MSKPNPARMYDAFYVERQFERLDLFQLIKEKYAIESVLYPGSFVHVTPSLVFPVAVYVDEDRQAKKFFSDAAHYAFIAERKQYAGDATVKFHAADYRQALPEPDARFDLLISQYAGFVSQHCKRYLRVGGLLLANNSHGDAGMAFLDDDYQLTAVIQQRAGKHKLSEADLDAYFVPRAGQVVTKATLEATQRGAGYRKTASQYVFRRVR